MKTKVVESENPIEHWNDIESVEGKVVLDLGCGWLFQPFESTPEYFIKRGAKKVIGVDASCGEIAKLNETFVDHNFICKTILEFDDLAGLIVENEPQLIKMDIEGYEHHMKNITAEQFKSVEEIAVEYHNPECKKILEDKLTELGFEIFAINQFGWFCTDINQMGIMHAKK
jgi:predicted RNA methylase